MIDLTIETPLTIIEVAALFKVHRRTVEAWFSRGLEKARVGGRVYTTREAIQRFAVIDGPLEMPLPKQRRRSSNARAKKALAELKQQLGID